MTSTKAVKGTPAKPSWSSRYAKISLMVDSPLLTPGLQVSVPNGAYMPLGLFGANGSSSIGLKTAIAYESSPSPLSIYEPLVPSWARIGVLPNANPFLTF